MSSIGRKPGAGYRAATAGPFITTGSSPASTRGRTAIDTRVGVEEQGFGPQDLRVLGQRPLSFGLGVGDAGRSSARHSRAAIRCCRAAAAAQGRSAPVVQRARMAAGSGARRHASQSRRAVAMEEVSPPGGRSASVGRPSPGLVGDMER